MSKISKQELISNLKDKISQFKSNFSKNKESRKENSDLNFEINKDALKLFYKNKSENTESELPHQQKIQTKIEEIYDIKKKLEENKPKLHSNSNMNIAIKDTEKMLNNNRNKNEEDNKNSIASKVKKNDIEVKEPHNDEVNKSELKNITNIMNKAKDEYKEPLIQKNNNINNPNINININNNNFQNNINNLNTFEYDSNAKYNQKRELEKYKDNNNFSRITLNNSNYHDFNIDGMINNRKIDKREKSAPKINISNYYTEKPLTYKKEGNNKNNGYMNKKINSNSNTEELYQKLLTNFNINTATKKDTFFNNFDMNSNNNNNYTRENNPNKSYGQINIKDLNLLYETNINSNNNNYGNNYFNGPNQRKSYFRNELNLDHLKDLYTKKAENNKIPTQSLKSKMDMFYKELNEYKNENNRKKQTLKNFFTNDKYLNNNKFISNNQYKDYLNNYGSNYSSSSNKNLKKTMNINEQINMNKVNSNMENNNNNSNITYKEIHAVKEYLNNMSKEEMVNLPHDIKCEIKEIFNILYQKFNY